VIGPVGGRPGTTGITWVGSGCGGGAIGPSDIGTINGSSGSRGAPASLTSETVPATSIAITAHHVARCGGCQIKESGQK
jgi:hypothetical protein